MKRNLYLNNIPVEDALKRFFAALTIIPEHEKTDVRDALGRVTGEAVFALCNSPLYDSAAMDGIAVISANTHGAGDQSPLTLKKGIDYIQVDTGDPVCRPYDAVIMAEDINDTGESVTIRAAAAVWQHVRPVGEDIVQGEMILPGGHKIRPIDIGVLLSGGITKIMVLKKPCVAILPTGTELVEPDSEPAEGSIIESNSYMFEALIEQGGGLPERFAPVPDDAALLKEKIDSLTRQYDIVLVCSGTSAGSEDYTVHILRELGQVVVHGVAMKPGKPVILAVVNGKPVIGLPGYPVSAYLAYENFAAPVLAFLTGNLYERQPEINAVLTRRLVSSVKHREYVRVKVGKVGEQLVASPLARGAGAAMSLVRADGFCIIEQDSEGADAGTKAQISLIRSLSELEHTVVSIGSHDMILDVLADIMPNLFFGTHLSSTHVGSMAGLMALKRGEAHIAPIHLLDEDTGLYNVLVLKTLFADRKMALIKGVGRIQGIMLKKGNPLDIKGIEDLTHCIYINRQRGAGTRLLLDYKLKIAGISPESINGYDREAATHMAVAASIKNGGADAGLGILSAAKAMHLDFVAIGNEEYDFAVPAEHLALPHIQSFIETLKHPRFIQKLNDLDGYDARRCGEVVMLDD